MTTALDDSLAQAVDAVDDALRHPDFAGLDEARAGASETFGDVIRAARDVDLSGGVETLSLVHRVNQLWHSLALRVIPVRGCEHRPALEQRSAETVTLGLLRSYVTLSMRTDLSAARSGDKVKALAQILRALDRTTQGLIRRLHEQLNDPSATLKAWHVRRWTAEGFHAQVPAVGYVTNDFPWADMHDVAWPPDFDDPAAVLFKPPTSAWYLAVSHELPPDELQLTLRCVVATITSAFGFAELLPGIVLLDGHWAAERGGGGRAHYWTLNEVRQAAHAQREHRQLIESERNAARGTSR